MTRSRMPLIAMLALAAAIGLAGCSGDDGNNGATGPSGGIGATGPTGPVGPTGPTGPSAKVEPRESCGVCHDNGASYAATTVHAPDREVKYTVIAPPAADGADLVVRFNIKVNGVNYDFFTVPNRAVIFNGVGGTHTQTSVVSAAPTMVAEPRRRQSPHPHAGKACLDRQHGFGA